MAEKLTDILTYALAVALAASVLTFAAYKVLALSGIDNPPVNMGLNFPPPKRKMIMDVPAGADPMITQSLPDRNRTSRSMIGSDASYAYQLLTVIDGVAFVAVDSDVERTLAPATVGTRLPGGPKVDEVGRKDGKWYLRAGNLTLEQAPPLQ